jgi:hypothetical protein
MDGKAPLKLTDLPVEVLHSIKGNLHDLQSHFHFSQTCETINGLYNETSWRNILFASGWSLPNAFVEGDSGDGEDIWEIMAELVVEDSQLFQENTEINAWITAEGDLIKQF